MLHKAGRIFRIFRNTIMFLCNHELKDELAILEEKLVLQNVTTTDTPAYSDDCITEVCVLAAARVIRSIDVTIDPCDDFYNFACGSWIKNRLIPDDQGSISAFSELREDVATTIKLLLEEDVQQGELEATAKAKIFYQACVNETMIEDIGLIYMQHVIEDLGGWPVLSMSNPGGNWNVDSYNFETLFLKSYITAGEKTAILNIGVDVDRRNTSQYAIQINQPVLGLPSRDYFLKGRDDPVMVAYRHFLQQSAVLFGADPTTAAEDAQHVVDMETELAFVSVTSQFLRDPEISYTQLLVDELGSNFTGIEWYALLAGIMDGTGETINMSEPVVTVASPYLEKVGEIIEKYPPRVIANYIIWRHVTSSDVIPFLPVRFRALHQDLQLVIFGSFVPEARWRQCSNIAISILPDVVGRMFVQETFKSESKANVLKMNVMFKVAFQEMIEEATWMDDDTKEIAKEKMENMGTLVGYPDYLFNDTVLNGKYKNVTMDVMVPLVMYHSIRKTMRINEQLKLRTQVDRDEWMVSPAYVTVSYHYGNNHILFPAAVLQKPFYQYDQPEYLSYGSLGYLMGIISMFAFSSTGRNYDQFGQLNSWWTEDDVSSFETRQQCFIDQYNNFTVPGTGALTINGESTLNGNIADSAAMRQAYKGYKDWLSMNGTTEVKLPGIDYTPEQLFFLGAAQSMCGKYRKEAVIQEIYQGRLSLYPYRIYGPLQNMEEFSNAFNCPVDSFMNPEKKCKIW